MLGGFVGVYCNGRVRCPWHGACFNIKTGDIEDFPGLDSLHSFKVRFLATSLTLFCLVDYAILINWIKSIFHLRGVWCTFLLAHHLSQRLTRSAYSIPMVSRSSSVVIVIRRRHPSSSTLSNLNISEVSWPILVKFYV